MTVSRKRIGNHRLVLGLLCSLWLQSSRAQWPGAVIKFPVPANQAGSYRTGVLLKAGDFVYVEARGKVEISESLGTQIDASGSVNPFFNSFFNRYARFRHAALLGRIGTSGFIQPFTVNLFERVPGLQRLAVNGMGFWLGHGDQPGLLLLAPTAGELLLEINDTKLTDNKGSFEVLVYRLTQNQHQQRNRYNHCPQREEKARSSTQYERDRLGTFMYHTDPNQNLFERIGVSGYRGIDRRIGCQCVYDADGNLVNDGLYMGTFDYAKANPDYQNSLFIHYILDVIPHIFYRDQFGVTDATMYEPTPDRNIDP